jgi:hypothetical protein
MASPQRSSPRRRSLNEPRGGPSLRSLFALQRQAGNGAVAQLLALQRDSQGDDQAPAEAAPSAQAGDEEATITVSGTCADAEDLDDSEGHGGLRLTGSVQRDGPDAGTPVPVAPTAGPAAPAGAACPVPPDLASFTVAAVAPPAAAKVRAGPKLSGSTMTTELISATVDPDRAGIPGRRAGQVTQLVGQCHAAFGGGKTGFTASAVSPCGASPSSLRAGSDAECDSVVGAGLDKLEQADNPRLLNHEQFHVKLACKVVDQANAALPAGASQAALAKAVSDAKTKINRLQKAYDNDSKHGCDASAQSSWEAKITSGTFP